jgi:hypothetical protein
MYLLVLVLLAFVVFLAFLMASGKESGTEVEVIPDVGLITVGDIVHYKTGRKVLSGRKPTGVGLAEVVGFHTNRKHRIMVNLVNASGTRFSRPEADILSTNC